MKFLAIVILFIVSNNNLLSQQQLKNVYLLPDYTQSSNMMDPIKTMIEDNYNDFNPPIKLSYNSFGNDGFNTQTYPLLNDLDTANNKNWVGIGFSAGGLMNRSIISKQELQNKPLPPNVAFESFITIATPNLGTRIASHYSDFAYLYTIRKATIASARYSYWASWFVVLAYTSVAIAIDFFSQFDAEISKLAFDMKPNSNFLNYINSGANINKESKLIGRCFVYGDYEYTWKFAGLKEGYIGSNAFQENIEKAEERRTYYHATEKRLKNKKLLQRALNWPNRVWARSRAGIWGGAIDAYKGLESDWIWLHDINKEGSDCFINLNSQKQMNTLGSYHTFKILNPSGGNGVYHNNLVGGQYLSIPQVQEALNTMGYE
jgi:hypothetical protein